jgi:hypothetical protein
MATLHCPLCGLRFRFASELDEHAREHCVPHELHLPEPRPRRHPFGEPDQVRSKAIR